MRVLPAYLLTQVTTYLCIKNIVPSSIQGKRLLRYIFHVSVLCIINNTVKKISMYMLWFKFILDLKFFELVSILFAIVPDYGNEYMAKENKN